MELRFTFLFLSFALRAVSTATECGIKTSSSRIVGGRDSGGYHYPWFALLVLKENQDIPICAGSLITQNHILTAAHCFNIKPFTPKKDLYNVLMGIYDRCNRNEPTRQLFGVSQVFVHEEYNKNKKFHDIALMVLDRAADYTLICLPPPGTIDVTEPAVLIGFGVTKEGGKEAPCHMMEAHIAKYSKKECERSDLPDEDKKEQSVICAGKIRGGTDSCQGDSGGPLQTVTRDGKFVVAGIVSYGYGCANPGLPGLYTNVASYHSWIDNRISVGIFQGKSNETALFKPSGIKRKDKHRPGVEVIFPADGTGKVITDGSVADNFPLQLPSDHVRNLGGTTDRPSSTVVFPD